MAKKRFKLSMKLKYELTGLCFITCGLLALSGLLGLSAGPAGEFLADAQRFAFGAGAFFIPLLAAAVGVNYIARHSSIVYSPRFFGIITLYVSLLTIYHHFTTIPGREILPENLIEGGGLTGGGALFLLRKIFGTDGTLIILCALAAGAVLTSTMWSAAAGLAKMKRRAALGAARAGKTLAATYEKIAAADALCGKATEEHIPNVLYEQADESAKDEEAPETQPEDEPMDAPRAPLSFPIEFSGGAKKDRESAALSAPSEALEINDALYRVPSFKTLLKKTSKTRNTRIAKEIAANAKILEETLESFKIKAKVVHAANGPAVTRYEIEPAPGVKVSKIVNLADDLALKLASPGVRIEAPIPGKAAVGIEVPNKTLSSVHLREVLDGGDFGKVKSKLAVGLGMDIGGKAIIADLAKMPHLLVAGATGSGKSVCINTLIASILFKAEPDEVKFILIDPKMVELSSYNGIPHLMVPVVTDAKKAALVLNWAVQEMEKRYQIFADNGVRDMRRYNEFSGGDSMCAIVIIIDELADLMMVAPADVEDAICRLAQKARAAGIHLVLATQRPSVDVITGIIKANVPSRISFSVSSQIDSRTILDMSGAEKLLGKGDMLYYPVGASKPLRVQGAFISDDEVEALIESIVAQGEAPELNEEILNFTEAAAETKRAAPTELTDELLEDAVRLVLEAGQASSSMLQRKFRIGFTRAARLIDAMEQLRIVGPGASGKPREILKSAKQTANTYFHK